MKTADELSDELLIHVDPPSDVAIVLRERINDFPDRPNWTATVGRMDLASTNRFWAIVSAFRKSDPRVDWSAVVTSYGGFRRIAKYRSEVRSK